MVAIHPVAIGVALVIQFVGPILVALWARFVYREQVRARLWASLALALTGLLLVVEICRRTGRTARAWRPRQAWLGESLDPVQVSGAAVTLAGVALALSSR